MTRWLLAALLAVPVALVAAPARAQDPPAPPAPPDLPAGPAGQPAPAPSPAPQPLPEAAPAPGPAPQPLGPAPQPLPEAAPPPSTQPPVYAYPPFGPRPAVPPRPAGWAEPDREHTAPGNWYGWQTLIAVAPFDIAMFVGLSRFSDPAGVDTFATAFVARNLVPAVVHLAHGRPGRAFGSIGLHAAASASGVAIGYAVGLALQGTCPPLDPCRNNFRAIPPGPGYGAIAGSMMGTLLDVVFFAHRQRLTWTAAKNEPSWVAAPFATQHAVGLMAGGAL